VVVVVVDAAGRGMKIKKSLINGIDDFPRDDVGKLLIKKTKQ